MGQLCLKMASLRPFWVTSWSISLIFCSIFIGMAKVSKRPTLHHFSCFFRVGAFSGGRYLKGILGEVGSKILFEVSWAMLRQLGAKMANKSAKMRPLRGSSEASWRVWGSLGRPGREEHPVRSPRSATIRPRSSSSRKYEQTCTSRATMEGALSTF